MRRKNNYLTDALLIALGLLCLAPLIYMVLMSVSDTYNQYDFHFSLSSLTLKHYAGILGNEKLLRYFFNSVVYSLGGVALSVVYSCLAGYAFAKLDFKGREVIFLAILLTMFLPEAAIIIPRYLVMKNLHWLNTFRALILPVPAALGVFLMRQSILNVPKELLEAARIDGCGNFRAFRKIILPLVRSSILMLVILTFLTTWNNFLWPLVVSTKEAMRTLPVGLSTMKAQYDNNVGALMASATVSFLPPFVLYMLLQRRFTEGVTMTGMKG